MSTLRTTCRRDGIVRVWDVLTQTWREIPAAQLVRTGYGREIMATLPESDRVRIERLAARVEP